MSAGVRSRGTVIGGGGGDSDHPLGDWKKLQKSGAQQIRDDARVARERVSDRASAESRKETGGVRQAIEGLVSARTDRVRDSSHGQEKVPAKADTQPESKGSALDNAQKAFTKVKDQAARYQELVSSRGTGKQVTQAVHTHDHGSDAARVATQATAAQVLAARGTVSVPEAIRGKLPAPPPSGQTVVADKPKGDQKPRGNIKEQAAPATSDRVVKVRSQKDGAALQEQADHIHTGAATQHEGESAPATTSAAAIASAAPGAAKEPGAGVKQPRVASKGVAKVSSTGAKKTGLAKLEAGARREMGEEDGVDAVVAKSGGGDIAEYAEDSTHPVFNATEKDEKFLRVKQAHRKYLEVEKSVDFSKYVELAQRVQNYVVEAISKRVSDPELARDILIASLGSPYGKNAVFG